jgi:hypothetical protein
MPRTYVHTTDGWSNDLYVRTYNWWMVQCLIRTSTDVQIMDGPMPHTYLRTTDGWSSASYVRTYNWWMVQCLIRTYVQLMDGPVPHTYVRTTDGWSSASYVLTYNWWMVQCLTSRRPNPNESSGSSLPQSVNCYHGLPCAPIWWHSGLKRL